MDFEKCDPEVFEACLEILEEQGRQAERERLRSELRERMP